MLAALALRVAFTLAVDPQVGELSDASAYHLLGRNLAEGRGYIRPFDLDRLGLTRPTAEYPPLLPGFLAVLDRAGVDSVDGQQLALCVLGAATVGLAGLLGRRVAGDDAGLVAAGLAAVHPMLFQSDAVLMTETPYALLVTAALLLAYRAHDRPSYAAFAGLGAVLGAGALTRSEGLLLAPLLVLPLAARLRLPAARRAGLAATALAVVMAVVAPWTFRNWQRFDTVVPVSNNLGTVLDGANCDLTYYGPQTGLWRSQFATDAPSDFPCFEGFDIRDPAFDEAAVAASHRDAGLRYAGDHLRRLPVVMAVRVLRTFALYPDWRAQIRVESLEGRDRSWQWAGTVATWLLLAAGAAGAVRLVRERRGPWWPLASTLVLVTVTAALTYGNQRFRVAAEPALVVLAAAGIAGLAGVTGVGGRRAAGRRYPGPSADPG